MIRTTAGQVLLNRALPADMRDYTRVLDKAGIAALYDDLARRHPEGYRRIAQRLSDIARAAATESGGLGFGLVHLRPTAAGEAIRARLERDVAAAHAREDLSPEARSAEAVRLIRGASARAEREVMAESAAEGNPLAAQVRAVGRGNAASLKGLRAGDYLYEDHRGEPIPIAATRSFARGLSPAQYWAASFGARKGVVDNKTATMKSGYLSKQLVQAAHRLVVTAEDADEPPDPASPRGLPVDASDPDNEGALLAAAAGIYPRDTILTGDVLSHLKALGVPRILIRSPTVGGPVDGGVYGKDVGVRERGVLAPRGDYVGIAAAQAAGEALTQGSLGSKHVGGVVGGQTAVGGFDALNNLIQVPETFPGGATHAQRDGRVDKLEPAPQGGTYVTVDGERHYVAPGVEPTVVVGDKVEAGDVLSGGIPNPGEMVRHKGIGEGRRAFVGAFVDSYRASNLRLHRRNAELLARGIINHVRLTDEVDDGVPGDIVPYQRLESTWEPRDGAESLSPRSARGKYLERPALHYTVGTPIRPSVVRELEAFGVKSVVAHAEPPPFEPEMVRGLDNLRHDPDWMTRHLGSNLQRSTLEAVHRGMESDPEGTSYVPAIAERGQFGRRGLTAGRGAGPPPRDGDGDGRVGDGTPGEAPVAPPRAAAPRRRFGLGFF